MDKWGYLYLISFDSAGVCMLIIFVVGLGWPVVDPLIEAVGTPSLLIS